MLGIGGSLWTDSEASSGLDGISYSGTAEILWSDFGISTGTGGISNLWP